MPKTITETTTRQCCQSHDLVSVRIAQCRHCGQWYRHQRYTDAAGDSDMEWVPVDINEILGSATIDVSDPENEKRKGFWINEYHHGGRSIHSTRSRADKAFDGTARLTFYVREVLPGDPDPDACQRLVEWLTPQRIRAYALGMPDTDVVKLISMVEQAQKGRTDDAK